jgi:hypothetical protein
MKQIIFLIFFTSTCIFNYAQELFNACVDFEHNHNSIVIDTTQPSNIWQIGKPSKLIFDSALTTPFAIVTDTLNFYPPDNLSSFQLKAVTQANSCWGTGYLYFIHKFDTKLHEDGGYIEVKYGGDSTWTNIINDMDPVNGTIQTGFYNNSDTIIGKTPAFSGSSNGWVFSEFIWSWFLGAKSPEHDTLTIRFTFKSDSIQANREGWMIDNLCLKIDACGGGINQNESSILQSIVYPNPVKDYSFLEIQNNEFYPFDIGIYDLTGRIVKEIKNFRDKHYLIKESEFLSGIYNYRLIKENQELSHGKFVVL